MKSKRQQRLRRTLHWGFGLFLLFLVLSHGWRWKNPDLRPPLPDQEHMTLPAWDGARQTGGTVVVSYRDLQPPDKRDAPVLILVHGIPQASDVFNPLIDHLGKHYRLIIPDLPGFGASSLWIDDYGMQTQARYLLDLLKQLGVEQAVWLGYSRGGGVAINAAELDPDRVEALILVGSVGLQEGELLGDYTLNHGLYGLQLLGIVAVQELLPHFGWLDRMSYNHAYARFLWDSDQRPLRQALQTFNGPVLVVHGPEDISVPFDVALAHVDLATRGTLAVVQGEGHKLIINKPEEVADHVHAFMKAIDEKAHLLAEEDSPEKVFDKITDPSTPLPDAKGRLLWVYVGLLFLATQVAEDMTCIAAGLLVSRGVIDFWPATLACLAGIFIGDMLLYVLGRYLGRPCLRYPPMKWLLNEEDVDRMGGWFKERGVFMVVVARFVPGSRIPAFFGAGLLHVPVLRVAIFFLLASALWTPLIIYLSSYLGAQIIGYFERFEKYGIWVMLGFIAFMIVSINVILPLFTWAGRRMWVGRWRRWTRYKYWPRLWFYFPVWLKVIALACRHRSLSVFTAANPAIPGGGRPGESKQAMLDSLSKGNPGVAAPYAYLTADDETSIRLEKIDTFMQAHGLGYPIVLKPDCGSRGRGVGIIHNRGEARLYLDACDRDVIVQAYVGGEEFGVFYCRFPGSEQGKILAITEKRFPALRGNGQHTVEHLILADDHAVVMARHFLRRHKHRLPDIPAVGESIILTELGCPSQGATLWDANSLNTPTLTAAMDQISRSGDGLYCGRFDIRVPSQEDFKAGRNLVVIDWNGVGSEAIAIHDPSITMKVAYRMLFCQWEMAFSIGAAHARLGIRPEGIGGLFKRITCRWGTRPFEVPDLNVEPEANPAEGKPVGPINAAEQAGG